jgi:bacterioferritin-associated ferredoxin
MFNINSIMYVCLCAGVTDHEIRETIAEGAASVEEVAYCTGAGTRCGTCVSAIAGMIAGAHEQGPPSAQRRPCLRILTSAA